MSATGPYRRSAERCRALAQRAESEEERKLLLKLAESWDWLTRDAERPDNSRGNPKTRKAKGTG